MTFISRLFGRAPAIPPPGADRLGAMTLPVVMVGDPVPALVTPALLRALGWQMPDAFAPALSAACRAHSIHTPARLAAFLAQIGHESGGGKWLGEIWGPTEAQRGYEGRADLGNTQPGDGPLFRGHGLIQITGRTNHTTARDALKPGMALDVFVSWLQMADGAATSAAWWWSMRGLNALADAARFDDITRRINGGWNGKADRDARWAKAKAALGI